MDVFSNLMVIGECLLDTRRTQAFQRAIQKVVSPGCTAMDIGTGSGILAMMSARAGAKKVYAIDIAEDIVHFARKNVKQNGLEDIVEVIHADAKTLSSLPPVDVITMELMDTGMVGEQQAPVINALHTQKIIHSNTKIIPYRYQCVATLIDYDFDFYGFHMPFVIQARNFEVRRKIKQHLSKRIVYADVNFNKPVETHVNVQMDVDIITPGKCNALVLESKIHLTTGQSIWGTTDLNMPVIIPLNEMNVNTSDKVELHIDYVMAEGFDKFNASLSSR